jgi:hypothetical protein
MTHSHYEGPAQLEHDGNAVEVEVELDSGADSDGGLAWWRGRFAVGDMGGLIAVESMLQEVVTLRIGDSRGSVRVTSIDPAGTGAIGSLEGTGAPPTPLEPSA